MEELFSEWRNIHVEQTAMLLFQISNSAVTTSLLYHPFSNSCAYPWSSNQHYTHLNSNLQISATLKSSETYVVNS